MTKYKESGQLKAKPKEKTIVPEGAVIRHDLSNAPDVSEWRSMHPEVIDEKCIGCATCVGFCPEATISMSVKTRKAEIDLNWCKGCGVCAAVCPVKAIIMKKER